MPLLLLGASNVFWGLDGLIVSAASYSPSIVMSPEGPGVVTVVTYGGPRGV